MNNFPSEPSDKLQLAQEISQASDESEAKKLFCSNLLKMATGYSLASEEVRLEASRLYAEIRGWVKTRDGGLA